MQINNQLSFTGFGYILININLSYFDKIHKHILLEWLRGNNQVLITNINYIYRGQTKSLRVVVEDHIANALIESIHKIVQQQLKPCIILDNNYQLTEDNRAEWKRKTNRIRDSRNSNTIRNTNRKIYNTIS